MHTVQSFAKVYANKESSSKHKNKHFQPAIVCVWYYHQLKCQTLAITYVLPLILVQK